MGTEHSGQEHGGGQSPIRQSKTFVRGYQPVLILDSLKQELRQYRSINNLMDSHMERTLASAALRLVMHSPDLQGRWREEHLAILQIDATVTHQR